MQTYRNAVEGPSLRPRYQDSFISRTTVSRALLTLEPTPTSTHNRNVGYNIATIRLPRTRTTRCYLRSTTSSYERFTTLSFDYFRIEYPADQYIISHLIVSRVSPTEILVDLDIASCTSLIFSITQYSTVYRYKSASVSVIIHVYMQQNDAQVAFRAPLPEAEDEASQGETTSVETPEGRLHSLGARLSRRGRDRDSNLRHPRLF